MGHHSVVLTRTPQGYGWNNSKGMYKLGMPNGGGSGAQQLGARGTAGFSGGYGGYGGYGRLRNPDGSLKNLGGPSSPASTYGDIRQEYLDEYNKANAENEKRYQQGLDIHDKIIGAYQPGGSYGAGAMASYQRGKTKATASNDQSLVSRGMYGSSLKGSFDKKYEEEVGNPFRLQLEDMRMDRLSNAMQSKAGYIERRTDEGPSESMYLQMMRDASQGAADALALSRERVKSSQYDYRASKAAREARDSGGSNYGGGFINQSNNSNAKRTATKKSNSTKNYSWVRNPATPWTKRYGG